MGIAQEDGKGGLPKQKPTGDLAVMDLTNPSAQPLPPGGLNSPVSTSANVPDQGLGRKINKRLDFWLLPLLSLLYLFNGLDRGNVGNAQTRGMEGDFSLARSECRTVEYDYPRAGVSPNSLTLEVLEELLEIGVDIFSEFRNTLGSSGHIVENVGVD
jgi:hypothetical protein